jgi:hypothetical protein
MDKVFVACAPEFVRRSIECTLSFLRLPERAELDVLQALDRVSPAGQKLLIQLAEDARVPDSVAIERLSCLWVSAAAINLADDLADGDCDYLEPRVGPGVSFLLQALSTACATRAGVTLRCLEEHSVAMTRAASGQSLEVRTCDWDAAGYLEVAALIAGEQYAAHLRLLWDGTLCQERAQTVGRMLGAVGLLVSDLASADRRFFGMSASDQAAVLQYCRALVRTMSDYDMVGLRQFSMSSLVIFKRAGVAWSIASGAVSQMGP